MTGILRLVMVGLAVLAGVLFYSSGSAWRKRSRVTALITLLGGACLLTPSTPCAAITAGIPDANARHGPRRRHRGDRLTAPRSAGKPFQVWVSLPPWLKRSPTPTTHPPGGKRGR